MMGSPLGHTNRVTLPETNSKFAPENRQVLKRKGSYSKHPFSGAFAVGFQGG